MPNASIEATVSFGGLKYSFDDVLGTLTHYRGWDLPSSYAVIELNNPHTEVINEFMNYGKITVTYGKDGGYVGPITLEIVSVANEVEFSNVKVRLIAVEPGFVRLSEANQIKSYPNQTVSGVVAQMAAEAGLKTTGIKQTIGNYTFIQPNISNMAFLGKYLLPLATDSSKTAPYLFTIDNGVVHLRPPNLTQNSSFNFILDPSKETLVKRFTVKNAGSSSDFSYGNEFTTHGYDFVQKGSNITHTDSMDSVNRTLLNKKGYQSGFTRTRSMPYTEQWMLEAHNRNMLGRAQFCVSAEALVLGENEFTFDQVYQFITTSFENEPTEYSGRYYVKSIVSSLQRRFYVTELKLHTNAFLKGEKTKAPPGIQPSGRVSGRTGGLP